MILHRFLLAAQLLRCVFFIRFYSVLLTSGLQSFKRVGATNHKEKHGVSAPKFEFWGLLGQFGGPKIDPEGTQSRSGRVDRAKHGCSGRSIEHFEASRGAQVDPGWSSCPRKRVAQQGYSSNFDIEKI